MPCHKYNFKGKKTYNGVISVCRKRKKEEQLSNNLSKWQMTLLISTCQNHWIQKSWIGNQTCDSDIIIDYSPCSLNIFMMKKKTRWNFDCAQSKMMPPPKSDITNQNRSKFFKFKFNSNPLRGSQSIVITSYTVGHNGGIIIFTPIYWIILTMIYS